jgi:hypothetical protein
MTRTTTLTRVAKGNPKHLSGIDRNASFFRSRAPETRGQHGRLCPGPERGWSGGGTTTTGLLDRPPNQVPTTSCRLDQRVGAVPGLL